MEVTKKQKCPKCRSKHIHTMGVDQFCLDCDWMNTTSVVNSGLFEEEIAEQEELLRVEMIKVQPLKTKVLQKKSLGSGKLTKTA